MQTPRGPERPTTSEQLDDVDAYLAMTLGAPGLAGAAAERRMAAGPAAIEVAIDETVFLLTLSLSITVDTPTEGRGGVQQNNSLADG